jgi:hypothetical protein
MTYPLAYDNSDQVVFVRLTLIVINHLMMSISVAIRKTLKKKSMMIYMSNSVLLKDIWLLI